MRACRLAARVAALVACALVRCATAARPVPTTTTPPPPELVVTAPVETSLDEPGLRDTQTVWVEMFRQARTSIDIEHFYISHQAGEALGPVLDALREAAGRGVRVRIVVDRRFRDIYPETVRELDALPRVEARSIDYGARGGVQHAKFFVVDGRASFLGSANFDWRALRHIHEVGLRIDDAGFAAALAQVFERDWRSAAPAGSREDRVAPAPLPPSRDDLTPLASPREATPEAVADSLTTLLAMIDGARRSIHVQLYEYALRGHGPDQTPWTTLDEALRRAAARGVGVRLIVDAAALRRGDEELRALASVANVAVRTVTIPRWSGGEIPYARLVHSKYMVVDDAVAWVGTENWDPGYFLHSRNVGARVRTPAIVARLASIFARVWSSPYAAPLNALAPRG